MPAEGAPDIAGLRQLAQAARRLAPEIDGCRFELTLPDRHGLRLLFARTADLPPTGAANALIRPLVLESLTGWHGPTFAHVVPEAGPAPLPFSRAAADLLLDAQTAWERALFDALIDLLESRHAQIGAAEKNSAST